jgi:hypothetical protein
MMIRGDWRDFRDDPPTAGPYFLAAAVLVATWTIILMILLDSDDAVSLTC